MKKYLILLLAFVMVFSMTACGSNTDDSNQEAAATVSGTISIGDGVEDLDISGKCYGEYTVVEGLEEALGEPLEDGESVIEYYCADCDTPYIDVYSIDKNGRTLEEFTKEESEKYEDGYYIMIDGAGYYTGSWESEGGFYYLANLIFEGDEQFHEVCFSAKTEEVALGDDLYVYIPTGYTEEESECGPSILMGSYDESYAFPYFRLSKDDDSYETTVANFSYNGKADFTEEQFNKWSENWTEQDNEEFFEAVGYKVVTTIESENEAGKVYGIILDNQRDEEESFAGIAYIGNYRLALWCEDGMPEYPYLHALMNSIHTK